MRRHAIGGLALILGTATATPIWLPSISAHALESNTLAPNVILATTEPFEFNGIDQSINLGRSSVVNFADGDFTVHLSVTFDSLTTEGGLCFTESGCDMSLVDKMSSPTEVNSDGWRVLKQSDNHFWFCLGGGDSINGCDVGTPTTVISQTEAMPDVWYSVDAVKTDEAIKIYVNGVLEGTTWLEPFDNTDEADLRVGANDPEGAVLSGRIGQVLLFQRALNSREIRALHGLAFLTYQ